MPAPITSSDLINEVRDLIDEYNIINVSDDDILQALNRAQDAAANLLARQYPEPLLTYAEEDLVASQRSYSMPEDIFEDRLQKVEVIQSGTAWEVKRISFRDITAYETSSETSRPLYYYIVGKTFNLIPTPSSGISVRYWYLKEVEPLVKPQGRITSIDTTTGYVLVDDIGSSLDTAADELNNYANFVDSQSGEIKATMQISNLNTTLEKITFASSPVRSSVFGRTTVGIIPSTVELDDYVCLAKGTCVPFIKKPLKNYVIQHAVTALKRKAGEAVEADERELDKFVEQVKSSWSGRELHLRVKKRSHLWN